MWSVFMKVTNLLPPNESNPSTNDLYCNVFPEVNKSTLSDLSEMVQTIVTQIEDLETKIRGYDSRLQTIDDTVRLKELTDEERERLHEEEKQIKQKLSQYESDLKDLRKENRKTMLVSVCLVGMMYFLYTWLWET